MTYERKHITPAEFTKALEDAVAERGADWVYPPAQENPEAELDEEASLYIGDEWHQQEGGCVYQKSDGTPACLIGVAMAKLGVELPPFESVSSAQVVLESRTDLPTHITRAAKRAQAVQDNGRTWGAALSEYKYEIGEEF